MTTTEKIPILLESSDVFDSTSSSEGGWRRHGVVVDYNTVPPATSFKAADLHRRPSCSSLARTAAPPVPRRPASFRRRVRTCFTTGAILTAVLLDRVSYFGIVGNLVLFCTNGLGWSSAVGVTIDLVFIGQ